MHKYTLENKIEAAVKGLMTTTKSIQEISWESGRSFEQVSKLAKELEELEQGILKHRKQYNPVDFRTDLGPGPALNMAAWRKEVVAQTKSQYHARISATQEDGSIRTRSGGATANLLAKYQQRSSS